ncbi:MAG: hypothetical protein R3F19_12585 [Verrucomicrobiales bacterium]|jgi:hypothetical protein
MRNLALTILLAALLGGIAYAAIFLWQKSRIDDHHAHLTAFEWFCEEFAVTGEQRAQIEALHKEYFPECEDHCVHYADTQHTLAMITDDPQLDNSPEHEEAARELSQLEKEADKKFIDFVYKIADEMDTAQSKRYLKRMKGWLDRAGGAN